MRIFLVIPFLITLATQAAVAETIKVGDVYYCSMKAFADSLSENNWELKKYKLEQFKFKVEEEQIVFGAGGYFTDLKKPISFIGYDLLEARSPYSLFVLDTESQPHTFSYGMITYSSAMLTTGTCDKF